jgi:hypothetical protein
MVVFKFSRAPSIADRKPNLASDGPRASLVEESSI